jgi:hypothetical protein
LNTANAFEVCRRSRAKVAEDVIAAVALERAHCRLTTPALLAVQTAANRAAMGVATNGTKRGTTALAVGHRFSVAVRADVGRRHAFLLLQHFLLRTRGNVLRAVEAANAEASITLLALRPSFSFPEVAPAHRAKRHFASFCFTVRFGTRDAHVTQLAAAAVARLLFHTSQLTDRDLVATIASAKAPKSEQFFGPLG